MIKILSMWLLNDPDNYVLTTFQFHDISFESCDLRLFESRWPERGSFFRICRDKLEDYYLFTKHQGIISELVVDT